MTEEQIAKLWCEATQSTFPKNGKFNADSTNQNLLDFALAVLEANREELRERISISKLAALTNIYWEDAKSYDSARQVLQCHCETAVEYADALIKELSKQKE